jgi:hypothetical protein
MAEVELVSVEDGADDPLAGEQMDVTASHLIRFITLNPYTYVQRRISVRNSTGVALPFNCLMVKPLMNAESGAPSKRVQDVEAVFSIEPESGVLQPGVSTAFMVTFAPPEVSHNYSTLTCVQLSLVLQENLYHTILHLVLRDIPTQSSYDREKTKDSESGEVTLRSFSPNLPAVAAFPGDSPIECAFFTRDYVMPSSVEPRVSDLTCLEIALKGECEPLQVVLQPFAIHIPGQILVETVVKQQFRVISLP